MGREKSETRQPRRKNRKLVFYMPGLVDGGAERVWALLASHFARRGDDVILAVDFAAGQNAPSPDAKLRLKVLGGGHVANTARLAALIAHERPDVVLSAIAGSNLKAVLANMLSFGAETKIIIAWHGFEEHRTGRLSWLAYFALPLLGRIAARTVCVSEGLKEYLVAKWHAPQRGLLRIYNPVEFSVNKEISKNSLAGRDDIIIAAGRLSAEKNLALLIDALALMRNRGAKLVIFGEGPQRARLEAQISRLGLADRVKMPGFSANLAEHYDRAKCLCLPSSTESFGNVIVEALGRGIAVVATDCAGPREILGNGKYGTIVPCGDAAALAAALDAALDAPGEPGPRQKRAAMFSAARGCAAYEALIDEVLRAPSKRP